jgi:hypothetical protein
MNHMAEEKSLRTLSNYLEFGVRLYREDFSQLTAGALIAYLPLSALALFIHPPMELLLKSAENAFDLVPRMLLAQLIIRVLQTFVLVLIILRIEARRKGDENVWDISEAFSRLGRVAAVDLAYAVGIQAVGVLALWFGLMAVGVFLGESPMVLPVAATIAVFVLIWPAIRYYFASMVSLLHATSFVDSFRMAGAVSSGGERLVFTLVMTYAMVWFIVWQLAHAFFGGGMAGQVMVQAGVMVTSIPYFLAGYLLYLDLVPMAEDRVTISQEGREESTGGPNGAPGPGEPGGLDETAGPDGAGKAEEEEPGKTPPGAE